MVVGPRKREGSGRVVGAFALASDVQRERGGLQNQPVPVTKTRSARIQTALGAPGGVG